MMMPLGAATPNHPGSPPVPPRLNPLRSPSDPTLKAAPAPTKPTAGLHFPASAPRQPLRLRCALRQESPLAPPGTRIPPPKTVSRCADYKPALRSTPPPPRPSILSTYVAPRLRRTSARNPFPLQKVVISAELSIQLPLSGCSLPARFVSDTSDRLPRPLVGTAG